MLPTTVEFCRANIQASSQDLFEHTTRVDNYSGRMLRVFWVGELKTNIPVSGPNLANFRRVSLTGFPQGVHDSVSGF